MFEGSEQPPLDPESVTPFWLFGTVTERLVTVLSMVPSSTTWQALEMVAQCSLEPVDRVLMAVAWDRQLNAASGRMHAAVAEAMVAPPDAPLNCLDIELGLQLRRSPQGTDGLVVFANRLVNLLPVMTGLMLSGDAGVSYARLLEDLTFDLTDEQVTAIDAEISPRAASLTLAAFRRVVNRAVAAADPDNARKRHERAKKTTSGARLSRRPDGMAAVEITMPAQTAIATVGAINERADSLRVPDDERTHGERQVEALLDALAGETRASDATGETCRETGKSKRKGKRRFRRGAQIYAFIDLLSLIGLRDRPGEIAGYGPVSADQIRAMLADEGSVLRRLVHDPVTGTLTDYSLESYEPDDLLREMIQVRDVTCRFPGCTRNAVYCDNEHCTPHADGGPTSCANCGLMCRRHHLLKTHEGFRYCRPDPDTGETLWETPLGFIVKQEAAYYYRDGRDTGDTVLVRIPASSRPPDDFIWDDDPPPD